MYSFLSLYLYLTHSSIPERRREKAFSGPQELGKTQSLQQNVLLSF